jgi:hypothetical protein
MDLTIQRYCSLSLQKVSVNGKVVTEVEDQESTEKSLVQTYRNLGVEYMKFFKMDNLSKLAVLAAECLLRDTGLYTITENGNVAVVLSNASSSIVADTRYQETINFPENYFPSPSLFVYTLPNIAIGEICIKHKIYGENLFLISKEFDADLLFFAVNELFEKSDTQYCVTGWVECSEADYDAFMLLVDKRTTGNIFTAEAIKNLYITK